MFSTWFILNIPGTCIFDSYNFLFYKAFFIYFRRPKKTLKIIKMKITVEKSSTKKSFSEWFDLFNLLLSININQYFLLFIFLPTITFPEEVIYTLWGIMKLHFFLQRYHVSQHLFFFFFERESRFMFKGLVEMRVISVSGSSRIISDASAFRDKLHFSTCTLMSTCKFWHASCKISISLQLYE